MIYQLSYASKTTALNHAILNDLRNILSEARDFNAKNHIHGVLYFADQQYFQCIEGDEKNISMIYEKIMKDQRHQSIKLLDAQYVEEGYFNQWSMKYVNRKNDIQDYFKQKGENGFNPIALTKTDLNTFLTLLYDMEQAVL